jgi:hypothetical protein
METWHKINIVCPQCGSVRDGGIISDNQLAHHQGEWCCGSRDAFPVVVETWEE